MWRLFVRGRPADVPELENALADSAALTTFEAGADGAERDVEALYSDEEEGLAALARLNALALAHDLPLLDWRLAPLPERDWVVESQKALPPVRAGRFLVHGAHDRGARAGSGATIALQVEAGAAFGTGHHETTRGCLLVLDALARNRRPERVLDLGCGSAVLAMAAARLWPATVLASDIDPVAVERARGHLAANRLAKRIRLRVADGLAGPAFAGAPFDLVIANILAGPLRSLAGAIASRQPAGGLLILSGLLRGQERAVLAAYAARGYVRRGRLPMGAWPTLLLERQPLKRRPIALPARLSRSLT